MITQQQQQYNFDDVCIRPKFDQTVLTNNNAARTLLIFKLRTYENVSKILCILSI